MICSISRKWNCYDNACAETIFSTIKCEMPYHNRYTTREDARVIFYGTLKSFYNRKRMYQVLDYLTPAKFREIYEYTKAA
jgi:hypothetical protein